jgi:hypothetical protein
VKSPDLVRYLAEFNLVLSDLQPDQVAMFVAARNAAPYVKGLEVPIGVPIHESREATLVEREADRALDLINYDDETLQSHLPTDEMDVSLIRGVEDLSRIFPVQWLWEELQPDAFYAKLACHQLLMPDWQRPSPGRGECEDEVARRELVEEQAAEESMKQHAYVLLDTSGTMQDHDRRGIVARGLALEFLRKGYQERAQLNLRPFAVEVGDLSSGARREDFRDVTQRIIELPNSGQTRIQTALEQAVRDIRRSGPCLGASILLITDGISRLTSNPFKDEWLHTFVLGDPIDEQSQGGTVATLKNWSRTFHRIWRSHFAKILAPVLDDCQAAGRYLQRIAEDVQVDASQDKIENLRRVFHNVRFLVEQLRRSLGKQTPVSPELRALEQQLGDVEQILDGASARVVPAVCEPLSASGRPRFSLGPNAADAGGTIHGLAGLWRYLKGLAVRAWTWAGRQWWRWTRRRR